MTVSRNDMLKALMEIFVRMHVQQNCGPLFLFFNNFYWNTLLYIAMLVSAVKQSDSAIHISPLLWVSFQNCVFKISN